MGSLAVTPTFREKLKHLYKFSEIQLETVFVKVLS